MNATAQHTPAPWVVCQERPYEVLFNDGEGVLPIVCTVEIDDCVEAQWSADARLIASSPELFSALHSMMLNVGASAIATGTIESLKAEPWWIAAEAAISKATGAPS